MIELRSEIEVTPAIAGGAGAIKLGDPVAGRSGKLALNYPFREVDLDWIEAYTMGSGVEVVEELGGEW